MKIKIFTNVFYCLIILLIFHSCNLINPPEQIPSYISIDKFSFSPSSESYNISDVWIDIDGQAVGAYELPATFPVLFSGKHNITITPGIMLNGISSTRAPYPFYVPYTIKAELIAGKIVKLDPVTSYQTNIKTVWSEYFTNPNISMKQNLKSDTNITLLKNDTASSNYFKYGENFVGLINLNQSRPYFEIITDTSYVLPYANSASFLELNYKSNNSFSVTVEILTYAGIDIEEYITFNPSNKWQKVYVNLTPITNIYSNNALGYKIIFNHYLDPNVSEATILIDNIKLITGS